VRLRKKGTGSSSHGHVWTEPGQVLDIPVEDAAELVAIAPHEFEALPDAPEPPSEGDPNEARKQRPGGRRTAVTEA
jgi:hypothetical protein